MAKICNLFGVKRLLSTPNGQVFEQEGGMAVYRNSLGQLELEYKTELRSPIKIIFNDSQEYQLRNYLEVTKEL